jgi:hypothetical protein
MDNITIRELISKCLEKEKDPYKPSKKIKFLLTSLKPPRFEEIESSSTPVSFRN